MLSTSLLAADEQEKREAWKARDDALWTAFLLARRAVENADTDLSDRVFDGLVYERNVAKQRWLNCLNAEYSRRLFDALRRAAA